VHFVLHLAMDFAFIVVTFVHFVLHNVFCIYCC
jgi:hypothetical protein